MSQQAQETVVVLKSCPHCGGAAHVRQAMGETWVVCGSCWASTNCEGRESVAVDLWNRRAAPVSPDSDLLKEAIGVLKDVQRCTQGPSLDARISAFLSKVEERGHD